MPQNLKVLPFAVVLCPPYFMCCILYIASSPGLNLMENEFYGYSGMYSIFMGKIGFENIDHMLHKIWLYQQSGTFLETIRIFSTVGLYYSNFISAL
jgi:hypothetical protein